MHPLFRIPRLAIPDSRIPVFTAAIHQATGHLTRAAEALGMKRIYLKAIVSSCPRLQADLEQVVESLVANAETMLRRAVKDKKPWAICFVLSHPGRSRGFGRPVRPKVSPGCGTGLESSPVAPQPDEQENQRSAAGHFQPGGSSGKMKLGVRLR
jgi:hypothetical protein